MICFSFTLICHIFLRMKIVFLKVTHPKSLGRFGRFKRVLQEEDDDWAILSPSPRELLVSIKFLSRVKNSTCLLLSQEGHGGLELCRVQGVRRSLCSRQNTCFVDNISFPKKDLQQFTNQTSVVLMRYLAKNQDQICPKVMVFCTCGPPTLYSPCQASRSSDHRFPGVFSSQHDLICHLGFGFVIQPNLHNLANTAVETLSQFSPWTDHHTSSSRAARYKSPPPKLTWSISTLSIFYVSQIVELQTQGKSNSKEI